MDRLRWDRALPACGSCINRGESTACCYAARKTDFRPKPQEPSTLSEAGQDRIDRLERLVLALLKNGRQSPRQGETPSTGVDIDHDTTSDQTFVESHDQEYFGGDPGLHNTIVTPPLSFSHTVIGNGADCKKSGSMDEAHWALLLNEVSNIP